VTLASARGATIHPARWHCALAAAIAASAINACGGDNLGAIDGGPTIDARQLADAAVRACSADAGCDDTVERPVCDLERGACVECLAGTDCARSGSFGPTCNEATGTCRCDTDDDCDDNGNGPYCDERTSACTCLLDADCSSGECELQPYLGIDVRTCRQSGEQ